MFSLSILLLYLASCFAEVFCVMYAGGVLKIFTEIKELKKVLFFFILSHT